MAQNQTYLLIPNIEEHFVGSKFSVAESVSAEIEKSISRALAEGIPLLHERRGLICPSSPRSLGFCAILIWEEGKNAYPGRWEAGEIIRDLRIW